MTAHHPPHQRHVVVQAGRVNERRRGSNALVLEYVAPAGDGCSSIVFTGPALGASYETCSCISCMLWQLAALAPLPPCPSTCSGSCAG